MNTLRKLQYEFLDYLLDGEAASIVGRIQSSDEHSAEQRMSFYGNAYVLRLKEALCTDYERLHAYVGDDLFELFMLKYIEYYPSRHPSLRYFSKHVPELLTQMEPFKSLPEVAEIAKIEYAFANSFDSADCQHVTFAQIAQLEDAAWASLTLCFHDAVQLLPQLYNSFPIWRSLANEDVPPGKVADNSTWLIWRQDLVSRYRALDAAELTALSVVMGKGTFADMCEELLKHFSEDETPLKAIGYLKQWVNNQMVCRLEV